MLFPNRLNLLNLFDTVSLKIDWFTANSNIIMFCKVLAFMADLMDIDILSLK